LKSELDEWWLRTPAQHECPVVMAPPARTSRRRHWIAAATLTTIAVSAAWILLQRGDAPVPLAVVPLTSLPGAELAPALSPDGKRLAFTWRPAGAWDQGIYTMELPDGQPRRLTDNPGINMFAEWSPDGRRIAYCRVVQGGDRLELRLADLGSGIDRVLLTSEIPGTVDAPPWFHIWTPDGEGLILSRPRHPGGPLSITLLRLKTGVEERLTPPVAGVAGEITPSLSPNGRQLVFQRRSPSGEGDLFAVELDAGLTAAVPPRQLTYQNCCLEAPSWTRDGREVVFASWKDGTRRLARISSSGGSVRFDPTVPAVGFAPRVAPDGRLVFHDSSRAGNIFRVDLQRPGAGAQRFIASSRVDGSPTYSPDGKSIVFTSDRRGSRQLWVCDAEANDARQLSHLKDASAWYPAYSPDGKWIAFEARHGSESSIYLANPASGSAHRLLSESSTAQRPHWSRDSRHLYFASDRSGQFEIWRVAVSADGKAGATIQLTRQGGYSGYESADGRYLYYCDFTFRQLRRVPAAGGPEEQVPDHTPFSRYPSNLAAGGLGIYYPGQSGPLGTPLWFLPFQGRPILLGAVPRAPSLLGMAVSPDDRWLLFSAFELGSGDILSVPGFH
jgi:Tol biopolymer transport system component